MASRICTANGCRSLARTSDGPFFRFPKDHDRCMEWLRLCGRSDLMTESMDKLRNRRLCSKHFDSTQFKFPSMLKPDALPLPLATSSGTVSSAGAAMIQADTSLACPETLSCQNPAAVTKTVKLLPTEMIQFGSISASKQAGTQQLQHDVTAVQPVSGVTPSGIVVQKRLVHLGARRPLSVKPITMQASTTLVMTSKRQTTPLTAPNQAKPGLFFTTKTGDYQKPVNQTVFSGQCQSKSSESVSFKRHVADEHHGPIKRALISSCTGHVESATQTEPHISATCVDSATQTDNELYDIGTQTFTANPQSELLSSQGSSQSHGIDIIDNPLDLSYEPSSSQMSAEHSAQSSESSQPVNLVHDRKFLVFESQLDILLCRLICTICHCPCSIDDVVKQFGNGTVLSIIVYCTGGHIIIKWQSQPFVGHMPAGNLLLCAATLLTGETFQHIENVANFVNMKFMSHTTFYSIQRENLIPVIMAAWKTEQQAVFEELRIRNQPLRLSGDGRMDSPGFSAKYCTYSLMDMTSQKVVAFTVVDVTETGGSSTNMEVVGFERCLQQLLDSGFTVDVVATDRHVQVRSLLRKKYPLIRHQFDVWHVAKSVRKKLLNVSHKKINSDLSPWSQSISNHLWWCASHCNGNADLLVESWSAIIHHTVNKHDFPGEMYTRCDHEPLTDDQQRRKKWLIPDSASHNALKSVVLNKTLLKDIRQLNEFCHTGNLEVYHSLMTKYCPKRQEFDSVQMIARTALAVLDHNNSTGREQKVDSSGEPCYRHVFPKSSAKWVAKPLYEEKTYKHVWDILHKVVEQQRGHQLSLIIPTHPQNIASIPMPPKHELLLRQHSRFH